MAKQKACKLCSTIFDEDRCPKCSSKESTDSFKGRIFVLKPTESEIAKKLELKEQGEFAIKTR